MATPLVVTSNNSNQAATTSHTVDLPASLVSGNLLVVIFGARPTSVTTPTDWTRLGSGSGATNTDFEVYYKVSTGGEGSSVNITTTSSVGSAHRAYQISGAGTPEAAFDYLDSNSIYPNSPSVTHSGGSDDYLYISAYTQRDDSAATGFPTGYTAYGADSTTANFVTTGWGIKSTTSTTSDDPDSFTTPDYEDWSAVTIAIPTGAAETITVSDYGTGSASQVFQRNTSGEYTITVTGTYNGTPANIEARIVDTGTSTPVTGLDWATLEASPTGGTFSGTITVPEGGMYQVAVRWSDTPANTAVQVQDFGVGIGIIMYGQSNMQRMSTTTSSPETQNALATYYDSGWAAVPVGNGVRAMLNSVVDLTGLPCFAFNSSIGATAIADLVNPSTGWTDLTSNLAAVGGDAECMVWTQGEEDGQLGTSTAAYKASFLDDLQVDLLTETGRTSSTFHCIISLLGNSNGYASYSDAKVEAIRDAQRELGGETGVYVSHTTVDQPLGDTIHLTAAGFAVSGERFAQTIAFLNGNETFSAKGPSITSVTTSGSDVILTIAQDGGSGLTNTGSGDLDVFTVSDDDFSTTEAISSYSIDSATQITITLGGAPTGAVKVRHNWGEDLDQSNVVVDNTSLALPLYPETVEESTSLVAGQGSYSQTGSNAIFQRGMVVTSDSALYGFTGSSATLTHGAVSGFTLNAGAGAYSYNGASIDFAGTYTMAAGAGSYLLTGTHALLSVSGQVALGVTMYPQVNNRNMVI